MKTFDDLEFFPHPNDPFEQSKQARLDFPNGYGVSVITGYFAYSTDEEPYEVAVMYKGQLCYDTPVTEDVIGFCTPSRVTVIMRQVQELPEKVSEEG
jgi:hypothetical protein